ncbi:MAG: (2Fe-2S)-binding protein [Burkholderiales bacterium]|nr:(2Fe-2S)-binding protein [Burkholderiales bacterium]
MKQVQLFVNGQTHSLSLTKQATLLHVLRNDLGLNGPKYGCGLGECGACTVLVDGIAARACVIPASEVQDRSITTLEGLATGKKLHFVQQAFVDAQAAQCGYCLNGMVMTAVAMLNKNPKPTEAHIRNAMSGNLCRCGAHLEIMDALNRACALMAATE